MRTIRLLSVVAVFTLTFVATRVRQDPVTRQLGELTVIDHGEPHAGMVEFMSDGRVWHDGKIVATGCILEQPTMLLGIGGRVEAAPVDKRATVSVHISPRERFTLWLHMRTINPQSADEGELKQRVRDACGLREIAKRIDEAPKGLSGRDFSATRAKLSMQRSDADDLMTILGKSMSGEIDDVLTPIRREVDEVLKGRDPYAGN